MNRKDIAKVAHEVNRAYCRALGDHTQPSWEDAPQWQRDSALSGVEFHINNPEAGPEASHEEWLKHKKRGGWTWGPEKDEEKRTHPCIVSFDNLPEEQQAKDYIFRSIVHELLNFISE